MKAKRKRKKSPDVVVRFMQENPRYVAAGVILLGLVAAMYWRLIP